MLHPYSEYANWAELAKNPLVSVLMPTYNHQRYLREAIEGVVVQQAGFPFELIIGEDASSDETLEIALKYWRACPQLIRVLTAQQNVGMHENAARLLQAARGRYVAFCEGDDCWHMPNKLHDQVAVLQGDPATALVCSSWRTISEDGTELIADELRLSKDRAYSFELDEILRGQVKTVTVCTRTSLMLKAMRESDLCKPGLYPFADAPLWVEASRHGHCVCLPQPYGTYRLSRDSATRPREIMDVYRFIAAASDFDRTVLGLYSLRGGPAATLDARIHATRRRLRALALLGDADKVRTELLWLSRLGARPTLRERLLYWCSIISRSGTRIAAARRWALSRWQGISQRYKQATARQPINVPVSRL